MHRISLNDLLDLEWTKIPYIMVLITSFLLSRIPFLNLGFGVDPDAWRIAGSAFDLSYFHVYHPSRFPGYPFPEYFNALLIHYGWIATNAATMVISLISVVVFAKILKELNVKNKGLLVITYIFLPILWINSTVTMDYMWALAFILLTWFFIIKKQYALAGLMMGLAIGSRITSVVFILPFIYLILVKNKEIKKIIYFFVATCLTALTLFLPLYLQYGLNFISYYPTQTGILFIWYDLTYYFGILAVLFGLIVIILSSEKLFENIIKKDELTIFLLFSIFLVVFLYIGTPYEMAYIIPAIPFGLVLLSKISKRKLFGILCIFLVLNSFISFGLSSSLFPVIGNGAVISDAEIRAVITGDIDEVTRNINNSIIISGEYFPIMVYIYEKSQNNSQIIGFGKNDYGMHWNHEKNVGYVYMTPLNEIEHWQKKGYKIYYMGSSAVDLTELNYKYNLKDYNYSNAFTSLNT
ncbi:MULTISPECIES: hypothetical protein [Methanobacterium]|uniref:Glycosyltransferase RgtA/B/C/D-like domain-containing protein n=1 Tax=Methanobacterium bryantii TaxID=2161 RepID=A0A2A2H4F2_METBR|nr:MULTISPECIES: hypothetical protein [Methanobacterium]OEC84690.1 hypothetical protein A9507_15035 [Methanobacterium sp. A39]PAV04282.1 hypothetical protein ASJ80_05380 [Methanobacterium bryantii]